MNDLLTVAEVAERMSVDKNTIKKWLKKGIIIGTKINNRGDWRIKEEDLDLYLEGINNNAK